MGVSRISQTKVSTVQRGVNSLLHRTQQHGMDLLCVRPVFACLGNGLELTWAGVLA